MKEFLFGIEHEVAFLRKEGEFGDFTNTSFDELQGIVDCLPRFSEDYPYLREGRGFGNLHIRTKRWYVEGYERFNEDGSLMKYVPKCIEMRTVPLPSIQGAVKQLEDGFILLKKEMQKIGFSPVWISYHPFLTKPVVEPEFTSYEEQRHREHPASATDYLTILSYGPDVSISCKNKDDDWVLDNARKLTYYSPFIVPFSFSSPFYGGKLWKGDSVRTYIRTGERMAVLAYVAESKNIPKSSPPLAKQARTPQEIGRIEFKAFDAVKDFKMYGSLLALLKGLLLDDTLKGRAEIPDKEMHKQSGEKGFHDEVILKEAHSIIHVVKNALTEEEDIERIMILENLLEKRQTPAKQLVDDFKKTNSIKETLRNNIY